MELIVEFVVELFMEGSISAARNPKISKWIRYPILFLLIIGYIIIVFGIGILGISLMPHHWIIGLFFFTVSIFLFLTSVYQYKKNNHMLPK